MSYTISVVPTPPAGVIILDPTTKTVTVDTTDVNHAGTTYVATITLISPDGVDTGIGSAFTINLYDVCDKAVLTPTPAVPAPVAYTLTDNLD